MESAKDGPGQEVSVFIAFMLNWTDGSVVFTEMNVFCLQERLFRRGANLHVQGSQVNKNKKQTVLRSV